MKFETGNKQLNIIGRGTTVQGKLTSSGSLHVDGSIVGDIIATDNVEIGVTGQVKGNVQGKIIKISGAVDGKIESSDTLTFSEKSVVRGDIRAAKLIIEEGAKFNGNCAMSEQTIKPKES
jgi:cytoskeletal protein CcmA (bactofilin family)